MVTDMDASSAQENCDTEQISSLKQTASVQNHEFNCLSSVSQETEGKHSTVTKGVNEELPDTETAECNYYIAEEMRPKSSIPGQTTSEQGQEFGSRSLAGQTIEEHARSQKKTNDFIGSASPNTDNEINEDLVQKQEIITEQVHKLPAETGNGCEQSNLAFEVVSQAAVQELMGTQPEDDGKVGQTQVGLASEDEIKEMKASSENGINNQDVRFLKSTLEDVAQESPGRPRKALAKSMEGKNFPSSVGSARVLRPRLQEKPKDPERSISLGEQNAGASGENKRIKKKKKQNENVLVDEFARTRKHLRYLLHRIAYEQSLIDAYSGEGWKGQSVEKLRPEQELQRAKSEIFRCKLKIRDLFRRVDLSIAEGRLPQSLFDSEGEIDSEDIFCAKCGTKDVTLDNDIILCDGACERAFHQFCVQPPLLKEDIPPDDEGWLCPGCDCKDDCIDLLNESQGTNLSILDSWKKVYPEAAAAAAAGSTLDNNLELPSDDSEDNDYKPDNSEVDEKEGEVDGSSSEDFDNCSASPDSGAAPGNMQMQLPLDESEDDDYDPEAIDVDEEVKKESSSSDFTSDSEDLSFVIHGNGIQLENLPVPDKFVSESSKVGRGRRPSLKDELSSLLETTASHEESAPISSRREVERLDYKKLYEEEYGDVPTDSSDEDFTDNADAPKRRRENDTGGVKTTKRRAHKKLDTGGTSDSPAQSIRVASGPGSSSKPSASRRLGDAATQGLLISFKENQYPDRATKEKLAEELGITLHQVSKWFENARWSFRHSPHLGSKLAEISIQSTQTQVNQSKLVPNEETSQVRACVTTDNTTMATMSSNSLTPQQKVQKRARPKGRKFSCKRSNHQASINLTATEEAQKSAGPVVSKAQEKRRGRYRRSKN